MRRLGRQFVLAAACSSILTTFLPVDARSSPRESTSRNPQPATASAEWVVVANVNSGPVTAYSAAVSGPVSPAFTIENPNLANTYWAPWGVASDAQGFLYVQTFLSSATTFVFEPGSSGAAQPARVFRGGGPDTRSVAIDGQGYEYIMTGQGPAQILVLPPAANGQPVDSYAVDPLRSIQTDESGWSPWPSILTTDSQNHVIAAVVRMHGNAIEVFDGGPSGGAAPIRVISGPLTGLDSCCTTMALTYSGLTGQLFVAVNSGADTHISVFPAGAAGNTAPVRSIEGPATGLSGNVVAGIGVSPVSGDLYALIKASQFGGPAQVSVFGPSAEGDVAPIRSFTDGSSQLGDAAGIALVSAAVLDVPRDMVAPRLAVWPNPIIGPMSVRLSVARPLGSLRIDVVDLQGRVVATLWNGSASPGTLDLRWDGRVEGRAIDPGIYWVRAAAPQFHAALRAAVVH